MELALQVMVSGLAAGAIYGLVAIGHSLVFRLTGVVHFAFGELIALAVKDPDAHRQSMRSR